MKKLLCSLLALSMCFSAFSCSDKKKDSKPEKPENPESPEIITEDIALEKPFIEYSENDFTEINVNLNYTDNEFPLEQYDITRDSIDLGAYISPCKAENVREKFRPDYLDHYDETDKIHEEYENSINTPTKGEIYSWTIDGDMFYCTAIYDNFCTHIHETAIFSYNLKTKETKELFRHSDAEESLQIIDIFSADGELYVINYDGYESPYTVSVLDRQKKELREIYVTDLDGYNGYITFLQNNPNRVIIDKTIIIETKEAYETKNVYIEYDRETGEWSEIYSSESGINDDEYIRCYGCNPDYAVSDIAVRREKPEGSLKYDIVSDYWRIPSGTANPGIIYASEERLIYLSAGIDSCMLHCVDFEKNEHYILDVTSLGKYFRYVDGYILAAHSMTSNFPIFCILPEYGMVFRADADNTYIYMANSKNGSAVFSGSVDTSTDDEYNYEEHFYIYTAK